MTGGRLALTSIAVVCATLPLAGQGLANWIEGAHPWTFFAGLAAFIVTGWILMLLITGGTSGWRRLARHYPALDRPTGQRLWMSYIWFGRCGYRNVVMLNASQSHVHFKMLARLGHPPFSVPWEDVSAERQTHWWWSSQVRLTCARAPEVTVKVLGADADRIVNASGGRWRVDQQKPASGQREPSHASPR